MTSLLFFSVLALFSAILFIIGFIASRKITTVTDYFLADRNLGTLPVLFTLIATQLGGGMLLGTAQDAYITGIYGILYTLGIVGGFLLLACGIAGRLQTFNVGTTAQLFETQYNSPGLRKFAALLSIVTMSGILIGQVIGAKALMSSLGFFSEPLFILFWCMVIAYTMIGGLHAVVFTDMFQVLFIIILFSSIFLYTIIQDPAAAFALIKSQKQFSHATVSNSLILRTIFFPMLFALIEQDLAQRFFASKSKRVATVAAFGAALFIIGFALIPIYFGMQAQLLGLTILPNQSPLIPVLQLFTSDLVLALATVAIIAAITSTADSLLCAISSVFAYNFNPTFLPISSLNRSKLITVTVGIGALLASYCAPHNIIHILIESYEISVSCLLVPLLFCYFIPRVKRNAALGGVLGGLGGLLLFKFYTPCVPKEILTLLLSLAGYIIGFFTEYHISSAQNKKLHTDHQ